MTMPYITRLLRLAVCLTALLAVSSCHRKPTYRIAVSQCSGGEWRDKLNDEMRREAIFSDDYNIEIEILTADDDIQRQREQLLSLAEKKPDVIAIAPAESRALEDVIRRISSSGIPVVIFDRSAGGSGQRAFVGADNTDIGKAAAALASSLAEEGPRAIHLTGALATTPAIERKEGFDAKAASIPGFNVVDEVDAGWSYDSAKAKTDSLLRLHPDVNLIFAHNDPMAMGASDAAKEAGLRDRITIIGVDGSPELGVPAVRDGVIDATVVYPTMGHEIMQTCIAIARGDTVPSFITQHQVASVTPGSANLYIEQHEALQAETGKIIQAKNAFDSVYRQHQVQTFLLISLGIIAVLLIGGMVFTHRQSKIRKRLSDQLAANNRSLEQLNIRLREATEAKIRFFTNVSHDLRTPLTIISSSIDRLLASGKLDAQQTTYTLLADKNAKVLTRLINQILDFSKYEENQLEYNPCEVEVGTIVRETTEAFKPLADHRKVTLTSTESLPGGFRMAADPEKLQRILYNLLSNAFKFTPEGGTVVVSAQLTDRDSMLKIRITDSGTGMSAEDTANVFDRYFTKGAANISGSGLGLAIVKAFVELHNGRISLSSALGEGTAMTIDIPVTHTDRERTVQDRNVQDIVRETGTVASERPEPSEDAPTLLVIDDNEDVRTLVTAILSPYYTVITAPSGAEGLKAAAEYVPDAVICDVMMPDMDGYETTRRLKGNIVTSHIPVLMLTACAMDHQRIEGYRQGADMYLEKPFVPEELIQMVGSLISNRRKAMRSITVPDKAPEAPESALDVRVESKFYDSFRRIVDESMADETLSVEAIADTLGMSRVQLYRKVKSLTGRSPGEVMRIARLEKARELLRTTDLTVMEVGYKVGFSSPSYFTKCYREHYGETPKDSRNK